MNPLFLHTTFHNCLLHHILSLSLKKKKTNCLQFDKLLFGSVTDYKTALLENSNLNTWQRNRTRERKWDVKRCAALQFKYNVSSQRTSKGSCLCGIFIQIVLLRAAVYEANIYKIRSTGINKVAFDEMPLRTKHVPCEKAKEEEHTQAQQATYSVLGTNWQPGKWTGWGKRSRGSLGVCEHALFQLRCLRKHTTLRYSLQQSMSHLRWWQPAKLWIRGSARHVKSENSVACHVAKTRIKQEVLMNRKSHSLL